MAKLPDDDVLHMGLNMIKIIGEDLYYTPKKLYIFRIFNITILVCNLVFIFGNCFKEKQVHLLKTLEGAITVLHALTKYIAFISGKAKLAMIINDKLTFWNPEEGDEILLKQANNIYKHIRRVQKFFLCAFIFSAHYHFLKPYFNSSNKFVFPAWTIWDSFLLDLIVLVSQYYCVCIVAPIVFTYDIVYISICVHIIIQLRLLKYKITKSISDAEDEIRTCIGHHQLLMSMFSRMQDVYSWVLLIQYSMSLGMTCVELYILNTGEYEMVEAFELVLYVVTMYVEFGYYSIPVEEMSFEFSDIANAIYMSSWYEKDLGKKRLLLMIMRKAQVPKYLYGGGLIKINISTFGSVFRKSYSLYLVLKNLV